MPPPPDSLFDAALPPRWTVLVFCLLYVGIGLVGHDPWKADEGYTFGLIWHVMQSGDWIVPTLAGEPFVEKPPIFFISAALTANATSAWLQAHDGARLASGLYTALSIAFTAATAHSLWGRGHGRLAALTLCGCLGLLVHSHLMLTDLALMAGCAVAVFGLSTLQRHAIAPGVWLGSGAGLAFLAKGVYVPGALAIVTCTLPFLSRAWRTPDVKRNLLVALAVGLPLFVVWPAALYHRSPELFHEWFWLNNVGRFLGSSVDTLGARHETGFIVTTVPWFTFPGLPLALFAAWRYRRSMSLDHAATAPTLVVAVLLCVLSISASARTLYLLPVLPALAVVAVHAHSQLPPRLERVVSGAGALWFVIAGGLLAVWTAIATTRMPNQWVASRLGLPVDYLVQFDLPKLLISVFLLLALAGWAVRRAHGSRFIVVWSAGVLSVWVVVALLWTPWVDAGKSYRGVLSELGAKLDPLARCLAIQSVGESERAMIDYFLAIKPERYAGTATRCNHLLLQSRPGAAEQPTDFVGWTPIWHGARGGNVRETLWLMQRRKSEPGALGAPVKLPAAQ